MDRRDRIHHRPRASGTALDSYIDGFALQERSLAFGTPEETSVLAKAILLQFPVKGYPHLARLTIEHVLRPGYDSADDYEFGLNLIPDGLEQLVPDESRLSRDQTDADADLD